MNISNNNNGIKSNTTSMATSVAATTAVTAAVATATLPHTNAKSNRQIFLMNNVGNMHA